MRRRKDHGVKIERLDNEGGEKTEKGGLSDFVH